MTGTAKTPLQGKLELALYEGLQQGERAIELTERILPLLAASNWRPIADLPDELKDGRRVLVWIDDVGPEVCTWGRHYLGGELVEQWADSQEALGHLTVTHFTEINAP